MMRYTLTEDNGKLVLRAEVGTPADVDELGLLLTLMKHELSAGSTKASSDESKS